MYFIGVNTNVFELAKFFRDSLWGDLARTAKKQKSRRSGLVGVVEFVASERRGAADAWPPRRTGGQALSGQARRERRLFRRIATTK